MSHMRYNRVGSKKYSSSSSSSSCHGFRGFRLNPRRFSVQRLRTKFLSLMKLFNKWKNSYGNALQSLRRNLARSPTRSCKNRDDHSNSTISSSRRHLVVMREEMYNNKNSIRSSNNNMDQYEYCSSSRLRSFARTNSFYTEAIADCLDFIKRNSLSVDENPVQGS